MAYYKNSLTVINYTYETLCKIGNQIVRSTTERIPPTTTRLCEQNYNLKVTFIYKVMCGSATG